MEAVDPIRSCALIFAFALLVSGCGGGSDSAELEMLRELEALREEVAILKATTTTTTTTQAPVTTTTVADFHGEDLSGEVLTGADLPGANFESANLAGANLEEADLVRADLTGVRANSETTWSEGFDPVAAGVIFE